MVGVGVGVGVRSQKSGFIAVFINIEYRDLGLKEEGRSFVVNILENRYKRITEKVGGIIFP